MDHSFDGTIHISAGGGTMSRWACTRCGSRDWPTADTSCPLCYEEAAIILVDGEEPEEEGDEP